MLPMILEERWTGSLIFERELGQRLKQGLEVPVEDRLYRALTL